MGWKTRKLNELFDIGSSKRVLKSQWQKAGVPFYRGREITALAKCGSVENELFITQELYEEYAKKYGAPAAGDIVVTAIGTIGNTHIVRNGEKFYFKDASVLWLKKISQVDSEYVNYWFKSSLMKEQLDAGNGATVDTLTIKKLQSLNIYFPSLSEQKQIVAILDDAFANIDHARQLAERNLKNARELFDSTLNKIFVEGTAVWESKTFNDVCLKIQDGAHHSPKKLYPNKSTNLFPYITSKNIRNNYMDLTKVQYVDSEFHESIYPRCKPELNDVLLTKDGANTGNVTLNTLDEPFSLLSSVCLIKPDRNKLSPGFCKYFIQSRMGYEHITGQMTGMAIKRIVLRSIKSSFIPLPELSKQESTVKKLDIVLSEVDELEKIYQQKITALDELKQSLLQKAFRGELTQVKSAA